MKNFLLDAVMFALIVAEMSFHHLPKILHEVFGTALTAAIFLHVTINRRRFVSLTKKISLRKIFSLTTDFMLTICAAIICVSGVCMSNYLFADAVSFELRRNMTIHQLHVAAPYAMTILLGVHVGFHWQELKQRLLNFFNAEGIYRRHKIFFRAAIFALSIVGVIGMFMNRVGDRVLMKHIFATPATDLHGAIFAVMIAGGVIFFAMITRLLDRKFLSPINVKNSTTRSL